MNGFLQSVPRPLAVPLLIIAGLMGFLVYDQLYWWETKEDYSFGFIVPLFVAYIVYDRWEKIRAAASKPQPGPASPGQAALLRGLALVAMAGAAPLFLFGALIRAGQGASTPGSLSLALAAGAMTLALVYLSLPEPKAGEVVETGEAGAGRGLLDNPRVRATLLFLFPAFIWIVSAPMLGVVEQQLTIFLLNIVSEVVYGVFNFLGIPIIREGNVLVLSDGNRVGVEDACSGIRSFTGCIFAGTFLGAAFFERFWKKVVFVVLGALLAVVTNTMRGLFLTAWAYAYGPGAIEGTVHDVAGYAVLGITTGLLLALLPIFNLKIRLSGPPAPA